MADDSDQLAARAKWCRRLARDSGDQQTKTALEELAQDCDRRVRAATRPRRTDQS